MDQQTKNIDTFFTAMARAMEKALNDLGERSKELVFACPPAAPNTESSDLKQAA